MTEGRGKDPEMMEIVKPLVEEIVGLIDHKIEVAKRPLIARIADLERQVAEMRGVPSSGPTSKDSDTAPAL